MKSRCKNVRTGVVHYGTSHAYCGSGDNTIGTKRRSRFASTRQAVNCPKCLAHHGVSGVWAQPSRQHVFAHCFADDSYGDCERVDFVFAGFAIYVKFFREKNVWTAETHGYGGVKRLGVHGEGCPTVMACVLELLEKVNKEA
jgi:hypothetical protein